MNGSAGCIPDTNEVFIRRRGAIAFAEDLFRSLCWECFKEMRSVLRSHTAEDVVTYYFNKECFSNETCWAGADYVRISKENGSVKLAKGELHCDC